MNHHQVEQYQQQEPNVYNINRSAAYLNFGNTPFQLDASCQIPASPDAVSVQQQQKQPPRSPSPPRQQKNHRALFAMKIKLLLKVLKDAGEDGLREQARTVISTCTRLNRMGDPKFSHLEVVVESYLRTLVGEVYWELTLTYQREYLKRKYRRQYAAVAATAAMLRARSNSVPI
jgi:hypothetical protein